MPTAPGHPEPGHRPVYRAGVAPVARTAVRLLLGAAMVGAGVLHLTTQRQEFQAQVPAWFPVDPDLTVLASGVVEIALGAAFVALPRERRLVGAQPGDHHQVAGEPGQRRRDSDRLGRGRLRRPDLGLHVVEHLGEPPGLRGESRLVGAYPCL